DTGYDQHLLQRKPGEIRIANSESKIECDVDRSTDEDRASRLYQPTNIRLKPEVEQQEKNADTSHEIDQRRAADKTKVKHSKLRRMRSDRHSDQNQKRHIR